MGDVQAPSRSVTSDLHVNLVGSRKSYILQGQKLCLLIGGENDNHTNATAGLKSKRD